MTHPLPLPASDTLVHDPHGGMARLVEIMRRLRDPDTGCPWDIEQDFSTIAPYTIEEAYEVADAIARADMADLADELGDLLLQVVYHAQMGAESAAFDLDTVITGICDKMIRRHPHVFGEDSREKTAEQQTADWEAIKAAERARKGDAGPKRTLDGVAAGLPALTRAIKLQNRAARVGFDWPETDQVLDKIVEEAQELRTAENADHRFEEFGDLMFVMANLARHMDIDPEAALRAANQKFTRRFNQIEDDLNKIGKSPSQSTLAEMDALWDAAKAREKRD
ncbi:ATP diphosphatase [Rubricella aquisinus]|uniref:Nucleoside triphosphate pyrophosphohydrolase n=1 Tax=Rubricella aquisinus TaxID=2028108 RepID=A0A840WMS8_9RHOB|nr:nucleoside triphosphate pyrophosphohydrolase [Rubricella aquisinus]MBB5514962.1 ATP diphosphatase [Rubricella aquisinus]